MRWLIALFLFVNLGFTANAAVAADDPVYDRASSLFHARDYKGAIGLLDPYLQTHKTDARAFVLRGDARANLDDNTGALTDYNAAIVLVPEYHYAYVTRCETRFQLNDNVGALADCTKAIALDPMDWRSYEDRGDVYYDNGAYTVALVDYNKAIQLGHATSYMYGARCEIERIGKDDVNARVDCAKSLTLDPQGSRALRANGRLALSERNYTQAIAYFNTLFAQAKPLVSLKYYRAAAYNRVGNFKAALDDIGAYLAKYPDDAEALRERGLARAGLGDTAAALRDLKDALTGFQRRADTDDAAPVQAIIAALGDGKALPANLPSP